MYSTESERKEKAKEAGRKRARRYYNMNPEKHILKKCKQAKWKRWAMSILKANMGGCIDCGYNKHPEALEFDHKPEFKKHKNISLMYNHSWTHILEEIAKCELVCANCHRIRTVQRRI